MNTREFFLQMLAREIDLTRKVVGAVPEGDLGWQPHERSRTAKGLIGHMMGHFDDLVELMDDGVIHHRMEVEFDTVADAVRHIGTSAEALSAGIANASDEDWERVAQMWAGDYMAWEASTEQLMWGFLFDLIHHRGQLSTYIRPMGGRVPGIYGPSADDQG